MACSGPTRLLVSLSGAYLCAAAAVLQEASGGEIAQGRHLLLAISVSGAQLNLELANKLKFDLLCEGRILSALSGRGEAPLWGHHSTALRSGDAAQLSHSRGCSTCAGHINSCVRHAGLSAALMQLSRKMCNWQQK